MIQTLLATVFFGLAIAFSPFRITAVILVLVSPGPARRGTLFLIGYVAAIGAASFLSFLVSVQVEPQSLQLSERMSLVLVVAGIGIIGFAAWQWRRASGERSQTPRWTTAIGRLGAGSSLALGAGFAILSIKNIGLIAAAMVTIRAADLSAPVSLILIVAFIVVASSSVAMPVIWRLTGGASAVNDLQRLNDWLVKHRTTIVGGGLVVLGFVVLLMGASYWVG